MMIDIIGLQNDACELLQQITFFVGSSVGAHDPDRLAAVMVASIGKAFSNQLESFFPAGWSEAAILANERLNNAVIVMCEIECVAALDAKKIAVDAAHVAVVGAQNFVIAHAERSLAAVRTVRADGRNVLHFPRARFVAIGAAGERPDRADVDAHTALFAFEMVAAVGDDDAVGAAQRDDEPLAVLELQRLDLELRLEVVGSGSVGVVGEGADPAAVVYDGVAAAKARARDVLIVDTAGRLQTKKNLMEELGKIRRILDRETGAPEEVLLVLDATTGQNGVAQARAFAEVAGITGIVLTKLDGTAKGGIVIAVQQELGIPVKLVGLGEGIGDLASFDPDGFVDDLLGITA